MSHRFADTLFTPAVRAVQEAYGSREHNKRFAGIAGPNDRLTAREIEFIKQRDTFYLATVSEDGWPYVQHRGGPRGFLRVLGPTQLGYADFRGNRQLISVGNVTKNDRVSLILMDYPNRRRLKVLGHMQVHDIGDVSDKERAGVEPGNYRAFVERVVLIDVVAFDWNCPQHISKRYTADEWAAIEETGNETS